MVRQRRGNVGGIRDQSLLDALEVVPAVEFEANVGRSVRYGQDPLPPIAASVGNRAPDRRTECLCVGRA